MPKSKRYDVVLLFPHYPPSRGPLDFGGFIKQPGAGLRCTGVTASWLEESINNDIVKLLTDAIMLWN